MISTQERFQIGHLIKSVFDESGMTLVEFARKIHCAWLNVYFLFDRYDIGAEQLVNISLVLEHNFFDDVMQFYRLNSNLLLYCLKINFDLNKLPPEELKQITRLLNELAKNLNQ